MPQYRRGPDAIEHAAQAKNKGGFRPFVPEIRWQEDGEKKFILVLTPIDEVGEFDLHEWIPVGEGEKANGETYTRWESFLSRKDPFVGENTDDIQDRLGRDPKTRCMGVAVELEPVMENVKGRQRPKSFAVKTITFERKTDDGEEEVTAPIIGLVVQSSTLVWQRLKRMDEDQGPLTELAVAVTRDGKDQNTQYDFVPFMDTEVDLSPVVQHLDGITYLSDDLDEVIAAIDATEDDLGAAQVVAEALFARRLDELADQERYDELVGPIEELPERFGKKKSRPSRPTRKSQRSSKAAEEEPSGESAKAPPKRDRFKELKARVESQKS